MEVPLPATASKMRFHRWDGAEQEGENGMIKLKANMEHELKSNIWGGNGSPDLCKVFTADELGGRAKAFNVITLQPGDSIGLHAHTEDSEIYFVLSSELTVTDNGTEMVLKTGDSIFTADEGTNSAENRTDGEVKMLAVIFPR